LRYSLNKALQYMNIRDGEFDALTDEQLIERARQNLPVDAWETFRRAHLGQTWRSRPPEADKDNLHDE